MKIAIVGAGSLGTLFGASLARVHDVCVLTRDAATARAIANRGGLVIEGLAPQRVIATHEREPLADCELVIVAVKTYATVEALEPLRDVLRNDAIVLSVQNGIDAGEQIKYALGHDDALVAGPTTEAARLLERGVAARASIGTTTIGWIADHGRKSTVLYEIARTFTACGLATRAVEDVTPYLWAKLVVNAAINPITAVAGVSNGALLERTDLFERSVTLALEAMSLAMREGVLLPFTDARELLWSVAKTTAPNRSSMLQDLDRGRPTEVEAILGTILRRAAAFDLALPVTRATYDEVRRRTKA